MYKSTDKADWPFEEFHAAIKLKKLKNRLNYVIIVCEF